jgi:3-mercaptopyruvate sulfurtransferase SseA
MKNNMKLMKKKKERENKGTIKPAQNFKWEGLTRKKKKIKSTCQL